MRRFVLLAVAFVWACSSTEAKRDESVLVAPTNQNKITAECLHSSSSKCDVPPLCLEEAFSIEQCTQCVVEPRVCRYPEVFQAWKSKIRNHDEIRRAFIVEPAIDTAIKATSTATNVYHCGTNYRRIDSIWYHSPDLDTIVPFLETSALPEPESPKTGFPTSSKRELFVPLNRGHAHIDLELGVVTWFDENGIPNLQYEHQKPIKTARFAQTRPVLWISDDTHVSIYDFSEKRVVDSVEFKKKGRVEVFQDIFTTNPANLGWSPETGFQELKDRMKVPIYWKMEDGKMVETVADGEIQVKLFPGTTHTRPGTWKHRVWEKTPELTSPCDFEDVFTVSRTNSGFVFDHDTATFFWDGKSKNVERSDRTFVGVTDGKPIFYEFDINARFSVWDPFTIKDLKIVETENEILVKSHMPIVVHKVGNEFRTGFLALGRYTAGKYVAKRLEQGWVQQMSDDGKYVMLSPKEDPVNKVSAVTVFNVETETELKTKVPFFPNQMTQFVGNHIWSCGPKLTIYDINADKIVKEMKDVVCKKRPSISREGLVHIHSEKTTVYTPDGQLVYELDFPAPAYVDRDHATFFHAGVVYRVPLER